MLQWKGEQQEGRVGKPLEPFEVKSLDSEGQPNQLVPIEFNIVQGTGEFSYKDERTDLGGNAIAEFIPSTDGWYRVECVIGEGDDKQVVPFKGNIKPDRRKRSGTTRAVNEDTWDGQEAATEPHQPTVIPTAAVPPPPLPVEQAQAPVQPVVQVVVSMPVQAAAPAPQAKAAAAPRPAPVPIKAPTPPKPAVAIARVALKPAPQPVQAPAPRRPQPQAPVRTATAVLPRVMPRPAPSSPSKPRPAAPKRRIARPKPVSMALVIAFIALYALLAVGIGILVGQSTRPSVPAVAAIECTSDAWVITGDTVTFKRCAATLR